MGFSHSLSIIMPTYNDERYIREAIDPILAQSFENFELIIINDASTDNSDKIINEYIKKEKRIKYLVNSYNKGVVYSINYGLKHASGDYVYFASSDDKILPSFFELCLKHLINNPHIPLCISDFCCFTNNDINYISKPLLKNNEPISSITKPFLFNKNNIKEIYKNSYFWVPGNTSIVKLEEIKKRGGFAQELSYSCDFVLLNSIAMDKGVIYIPKTLCLMRVIRDENTHHNNRKFKEKLRNVDILVSYIKKRKHLWKDFYKSTCLARNIHLSFYLILLKPKHWDIAVPMLWQKLNIIRSRKKREKFVPNSLHN